MIYLDVNAVAWFKSYLSNRSQVTAINQSYSSPRARPVPVGVPQGSILGPLLFLVYINDLPNCMKHCKIMQYADDTLIYYSAKSPIEIVLNRSDHVDNLISKISQRLGLLRRVKHLLPVKVRKTLYNSLALPLFDYSDLIWGDKNNKTVMDYLQV